MEQIASFSFNQAVEQLHSFPGIGKKTAIRLVLNLLGRNREDIDRFGKVFIDLSANINYCVSCFNISDDEKCAVCNNPKKIQTSICVVENVLDVISIEKTNQFGGVYHVLGGIISPMEGIGPSDLKIIELIERVKNNGVKEIVMALSTTMEGDATNYYLYKKLKDFNVKITTIARGVGLGNELEYTDELTLGRSILNRIPFEQTLSLGKG